MKIGVLSNTNIDLLVKKLEKKYEVYKPDGYGIWVQELIDEESKINQTYLDYLFILLDGEEIIKDSRSIEEMDNEFKKYIYFIKKYVHNNEDIKIFVSNIDIPQIQIHAIKNNSIEKVIEGLWLKRLMSLKDKYKNLYIFDIKNLIENIGKRNFYSLKLWYAGGIKYTPLAENQIIELIEQIVNSNKINRKKCLILDLDNTVWGGVIGEDGISSIELSNSGIGLCYKNFQKRISELASLGVMLAVVSKNNFGDAISAIREHPHMVLTEDKFVLMKINWSSKVTNIREICYELNIGLDSVVFIDDSQYERELVKVSLPEVVVPEFPKDITNLEQFIIDLYKKYFYSLEITNEDLNKTTMYRQNIDRQESKNNYDSLEKYLQSLETKIRVYNLDKGEISRVVQLINKTNQFNLTGKRYTEEEINIMIKSNNHRIFIASVKDKFGDNGICSVIIANNLDEETAVIDTFLMSCRVMGRCIEDSIIDYIEDSLFKLGYKRIIGMYRYTDKNSPVKDFYKRLGYSLLEHRTDRSEVYELDISSKKLLKRNIYAELIAK